MIILNSRKSTIGSPYSYYTVDATTSNRTTNSVDVTISVTTRLANSNSVLGTGQSMGLYSTIILNGQSFRLQLKSTSEYWSGTTSHVSTSTFTITELEPTQTTMTAKFEVSRTGTADDGRIANSCELELTDCSNIMFEVGHTPPTNVTYEILETNEKLIDLGINNTTFVKDLSIKSFNITGTLYDEATIKGYAILNRTNIFSSNTLPVIVDLSQRQLQTDLNYTTKIPINAQILDSFDTAGYSTTDLYDYIPYNKIGLIETSTTVKRNGQTSGKARLNINGTYFNGDLGSAIQSGEYKPTIKYKFWKLGEEEPSTYDYEIPSENITTNEGNYSVSNYEIGTSDESQINWFDPDYAYRVVVYVEDNLTHYQSTEKSIAVGEATWSEYKDRLEVKKMYIKKLAVNGTYDETNDNPLQVYDNDGNPIFTGKEIIVANLTSGYSGTSSAYSVFPLNLTKHSVIGKKLSVENGKVKIGAGISKVIISATISFPGEDVVSDLWITKYSSNEETSLIYIPDAPYGYYRSIGATPFICEVQEGDLISLGIYTNDGGKRFSVTGNAERLTTYMTVEVVA